MGLLKAALKGKNLEITPLVLEIASNISAREESLVVVFQIDGQEVRISIEQFCHIVQYVMNGGYFGWQEEAPKCVKEAVSFLCAKIS